MQRRMRVPLAVLAIVCAGAASERPPASLTLAGRTIQQQQPVEQQTPGGATQPDHSLWVVNPTPCAWDADDQFVSTYLGDLDAGASQSWSECLIGDGSDHVIGLRVRARTGASFQVTVSAVPGYAVSADSGPLTNQYVYAAACLVGPVYQPNSPLLQPVPGSNGGVGVQVALTYTVTNTGTRRMREVWAESLIGLQSNVYEDLYCPTMHWVSQTGACAGVDPHWCWSPP